MFVHEDERRKLLEMPGGAVCKAVIAKHGCVVGQHHHRYKDETFMLASGHALRVVVGDEEWYNIDAPFVWHVPRGTYHSFALTEDSVLVGVATAEFDPKDEIKGHPNSA